MKIAIVSGKGGVGKSMLASSLAMLFNKAGKKIVAVDADVDAPNMAAWLNETGRPGKVKKLSTSFKPVFNYNKCAGCGDCVKACKFGAITMENGKPKVNPFLCEGCGACEVLCPRGAITLRRVKNGELRVKRTKCGFFLVSGHLYPGETGSGKIVTEIKKQGEKFDYEVMIVDSSPGTGCPVIASLQDADFAVLVTEPTPSAFSDLKRILKIVKHFSIPFSVVVNKSDLNPGFGGKIKKEFKGKILGEISYDQKIFKSISRFQPIVETDLKAKREIKEIFKKLKKIVGY